MSQRLSAITLAGGVDPASVGRVAVQVGLGVVAVALPVTLWAGAGLFASGGFISVVAALDGPFLAGSGPAWLFRVAAMSLFGGCWLLGAGLVLDGLFD